MPPKRKSTLSTKGSKKESKSEKSTKQEEGEGKMPSKRKSTVPSKKSRESKSAKSTKSDASDKVKDEKANEKEKDKEEKLKQNVYKVKLVDPSEASGQFKRRGRHPLLDWRPPLGPPFPHLPHIDLLRDCHAMIREAFPLEGALEKLRDGQKSYCSCREIIFPPVNRNNVNNFPPNNSELYKKLFEVPIVNEPNTQTDLYGPFNNNSSLIQPHNESKNNPQDSSLIPPTTDRPRSSTLKPPGSENINSLRNSVSFSNTPDVAFFTDNAIIKPSEIDLALQEIEPKKSSLKVRRGTSVAPSASESILEKEPKKSSLKVKRGLSVKPSEPELAPDDETIKTDSRRVTRGSMHPSAFEMPPEAERKRSYSIKLNESGFTPDDESIKKDLRVSRGSMHPGAFKTTPEDEPKISDSKVKIADPFQERSRPERLKSLSIYKNNERPRSLQFSYGYIPPNSLNHPSNSPARSRSVSPNADNRPSSPYTRPTLASIKNPNQLPGARSRAKSIFSSLTGDEKVSAYIDYGQSSPDIDNVNSEYHSPIRSRDNSRSPDLLADQSFRHGQSLSSPDITTEYHSPVSRSRDNSRSPSPGNVKRGTIARDTPDTLPESKIKSSLSRKSTVSQKSNPMADKSSDEKQSVKKKSFVSQFLDDTLGKKSPDGSENEDPYGFNKEAAQKYIEYTDSANKEASALKSAYMKENEECIPPDPSVSDTEAFELEQISTNASLHYHLKMIKELNDQAAAFPYTYANVLEDHADDAADRRKSQYPFPQRRMARIRLPVCVTPDHGKDYRNECPPPPDMSSAVDNIIDFVLEEETRELNLRRLSAQLQALDSEEMGDDDTEVYGNQHGHRKSTFYGEALPRRL